MGITTPHPRYVGGAGAWSDIPGTGTAIGTGKANTDAILAIDENAPAAKACKDYRGGGKDDWFLPSKDELDKMYNARSHLNLGSGTPGWFWSSSQLDESHAYQRLFGDGTSEWEIKAGQFFVLAVRTF